MIISSASSILTGRFMLAGQFRNAFATSIIAMGTALCLSGLLSIALGAIDGQQLTKLFISTAQLPFFVQGLFFTQVRNTANYFIGLALINTLHTLSSSYLGQSFAYSELQKTAFICSLVITNAAILATFFGSGNETKGLIRITLAGSVLTMLLLLYQWLKVSDFQCYQKVIDHSSSAAQQDDRYNSIERVISSEEVYHSPIEDSTSINEASERGTHGFCSSFWRSDPKTPDSFSGAIELRKRS